MVSKTAVFRFTSTYRATLAVNNNAAKMVSTRSMSAFSNMVDNDPEVLEKEKHKTLNKKTKEWNEKLASHSEAVVKADKDKEKSVFELQSETVEKFEKEKKESA